MDNKRWYNRFATIFWWGLTILPLIIALIYFIGYHLTFNSGITSALELENYHTASVGDFSYFLDSILYGNTNVFFTFNEISLSFITSMFYDLFDLLGIQELNVSSILFSWMVSVQFYHLLFDFIVWLPQWFHRIMEKGMDKLS